ncbi:MAG: type IV toxin-antitoxin system AbiEi family antitoxin domain-containing protein [Planctomycetia bacterium]|nr:type IV toxin-antitoxin system AbiEi family antitoxin domain-containing protein [Planctomycetia bacterium]
MEGLGSLRPDLVRDLLTACTSVKAKRLFLYMAEKANHQWLRFVDTSSLDLGKGERSLSKGGFYVAKYHLVVPSELTGL